MDVHRLLLQGSGHRGLWMWRQSWKLLQSRTRSPSWSICTEGSSCATPVGTTWPHGETSFKTDAKAVRRRMPSTVE